VWLAVRHPNRPTWLLPATLALGFFALEPFNFAIPVLGVVDDLFLLPFQAMCIQTRAGRVVS
jgi:uncharacterized membrane protein YkvA (DUF1232 family)